MSLSLLLPYLVIKVVVFTVTQRTFLKALRFVDKPIRESKADNNLIKYVSSSTFIRTLAFSV